MICKAVCAPSTARSSDHGLGGLGNCLSARHSLVFDLVFLRDMRNLPSLLKVENVVSYGNIMPPVRLRFAGSLAGAIAAWLATSSKPPAKTAGEDRQQGDEESLRLVQRQGRAQAEYHPQTRIIEVVSGHNADGSAMDASGWLESYFRTTDAASGMR